MGVLVGEAVGLDFSNLLASPPSGRTPHVHAAPAPGSDSREPIFQMPTLDDLLCSPPAVCGGTPRRPWARKVPTALPLRHVGVSQQSTVEPAGIQDLLRSSSLT